MTNDGSDAATRLPAVFGRYLLLQRLSRGGMGEIFLAKLGEIEGFEKLIVIKRILPDLSRDRDFVQRFIEEAKIAIQLSHANIVPVYEVGQAQGQYFLAMEYVAGRDLRTLLDRVRSRGKRLAPDLCLLLVREIANGLAYAHRRTDEAGRPLRLVHCDISPPNVLVSYDGEVRIIDFGIARSALQRSEDEDLAFGKFGYMAPEQLLRGADVDHRADIYATGVVLYELLTGQRLFNFPPRVELRRVVSEVTAGRFARPSERDPSLGDSFDTLVMRALRTEPRERFSSAVQLRDAVQQQLYRMSPTISADSLAACVDDLFAEDIGRERKMLKALSRTDVTGYRDALAGAAAHTVSFALGEVYTQHAIGTGREALFGATAPAAEATVEVADELLSPGTRRMGSATRAAAAAAGASPGERKLRWLLLLSAAVGSLVALAAVLLLVDSPESGSSPRLAAAQSGRAGGATADGTRVGDGGVAVGSGRVEVAPLDPAELAPRPSRTAAPTTEHRAGSGARAAGSAARSPDASLTFAPDPIQRTRRRRGRRRRRIAHKHRRKAARTGRRKTGRRKTAHAGRRRKAVRSGRSGAQPQAERAVTAKRVRRKFSRVRRQYQRFAAAYGGRLDAHWQRILFAYTYGHASPQKLDQMLEDLQRRMKRISR